MSRFTIDTNILFYAIQATDPRSDAALGILDRARFADCRITLQAYGEFFSSSVRKRQMTAQSASLQIGRWMTLFGDPVPGSGAALSEAMAAASEQRFAFWDAMLLATAEAAGCTAIISEDMAPGARLGRIRVIPAFAGDAVSPQAVALLA